MNRTWKILLAVLLAAGLLCIFALSSADAVPDGLYCIDGTWQLYIGGQYAGWYTGLWNDPALGWWLVGNGNVCNWYTGLYEDSQLGWLLISNGSVCLDYNGAWNDPNLGPWIVVAGRPTEPATDGLHDDGTGWHLYLNGTVADWYSGLWNDPAVGWWLVNGGAVDFGYTGLYCDANVGWWLVGGGAVCFDYNGLWGDPVYGWWLVNGGSVRFDYSGLWGDPVCGWWLVNGGAVDFGYTGLYEDPNYGWWLLGGGAVCFDYNGAWGDPVYGAWMITGGQPTAPVAASDGLADDGTGWHLYRGGSVDWAYNGLYCDPTYGWWLVQGGTVAFGETGLIRDAVLGWWLVRGGAVDFGYTGIWPQDGVNWYVSGGNLNMDYTGIVRDPQRGLIMVTGGVFNDLFYGVAKSADGKSWAAKNGIVDTSFTGMFYDDHFEGSWVYVKNGEMQPDYTGVAYNEKGAFYFDHGKIVFDYTGPAQDGDKWVYLRAGQKDEGYTGVAEIEGAKLYYRDGALDTSYTGIAQSPEGSYFVKNGKIDLTYTGEETLDGVTYKVVKGLAEPVSGDNPLLAVFYNSLEDSSDTLYISFDGYTFLRLGEAFTDSDRTNASVLKATVSPSADSQFSDITVNVMRDPCLFYKDGAFWLLTGSENGNGEYVPVMSYSTDLKTWSFPSPGKDYLQSGLTPTVTPLDANGNRTNRTNYNGVAVDGFVDDDGTVWMTVALGAYTHNENNKVSQYLFKATGLKAPGTSADMTDEFNTVLNSAFDVTYGSLVPVNLPGVDYSQKGVFDYDASLFKENGKYYLLTQHNGEDVQLWSIADLNNASTASAWTLVNDEVVHGSEGPSMTKQNGKYVLYSDRFDNQDFKDEWGNYHGILASSGTSLDKTFTDYARIKTLDENRNEISARHGTVITLENETARSIVMNRYREVYQVQ